MDPDFEVDGFPFPFVVTYAGLLRMAEFLTQSLKASPLDINKEDNYGYNLYPKK